jgi:hypothetical protein
MVEKAFVDDARRKRSHIIFVWVGGGCLPPAPFLPAVGSPLNICIYKINNIHDELVEEQREEEEQATPWLESSI